MYQFVSYLFNKFIIIYKYFLYIVTFILFYFFFVVLLSKQFQMKANMNLTLILDDLYAVNFN
jgi:hypothetical protein